MIYSLILRLVSNNELRVQGQDFHLVLICHQLRCKSLLLSFYSIGEVVFQCENDPFLLKDFNLISLTVTYGSCCLIVRRRIVLGGTVVESGD